MRRKREREKKEYFLGEFECPTRETRNTQVSWCFSFSLSLSLSFRSFPFGRRAEPNFKWMMMWVWIDRGPPEFGPKWRRKRRKKEKKPIRSNERRNTHTHTDIWGPDEMRALEKTEKSSSFFHLPSPFAAFPLFCLTSREPKLVACTHHPGHGLGAKAHGAECRLKNHFHSMDVVGVAKRERDKENG